MGEDSGEDQNSPFKEFIESLDDEMKEFSGSGDWYENYAASLIEKYGLSVTPGLKEAFVNLLRKTLNAKVFVPIDLLHCINVFLKDIAEKGYDDLLFPKTAFILGIAFARLLGDDLVEEPDEEDFEGPEDDGPLRPPI